MKIEEVAGETVSAETQSAIATAVTNLESQFVDVTLNSVYNGTIFATEQVEINVNADLGNLSSVFSPASRYGLTCTGVTTEVTSNPIPAGSVFTTTYVDNASETLPFTVSTLTDGAFGEGMHWYTLFIRKEARQSSSNNGACPDHSHSIIVTPLKTTQDNEKSIYLSLIHRDGSSHGKYDCHQSRRERRHRRTVVKPQWRLECLRLERNL